MRNVLIIAIILFITGCAKHDGYNINGNVPEAWEGKLVFLTLADINAPRHIDSTTVKDGKFNFKGNFEMPRYCNVRVYLDADDRTTRSKMVNFALFVDNNEIEAICDNSGLQPIFTVSGSQTEDEYQNLLGVLDPLVESRSKTFYSYTDAYYSGNDLQKAIELANEVNAKAGLIREAKINYLKSNPSSVISVKVANDLVDRNSDLSLKEIEELYATLSPELQNSEMGQSLRETIDKRMVFIGDSFIDHELETPDGSKKKISDFVKPGHTTLIEFWASWCAPCRSEIPHIRNTYDNYHAKGLNILSVSIDSNRDHWMQALEEEQLPWGHLIDQKSVAFKKYNLTGVPSSILLDENGTIISVNARGGWLDAAMQEIYDK